MSVEKGKYGFFVWDADLKADGTRFQRVLHTRRQIHSAVGKRENLDTDLRR